MAGARTGWLPLLARGSSLERGSGEALRFFQHRFWMDDHLSLLVDVDAVRDPPERVWPRVLSGGAIDTTLHSTMTHALYLYRELGFRV